MPKTRKYGDPYENLANAIVLQAAEDYMRALRRYKRDPDNYLALRAVKENERFFYSDWFSVLTSMDPDYLIEILRKKVDA